jgi:hypothetical protein
MKTAIGWICIIYSSFYLILSVHFLANLSKFQKVDFELWIWMSLAAGACLGFAKTILVDKKPLW